MFVPVLKIYDIDELKTKLDFWQTRVGIAHGRIKSAKNEEQREAAKADLTAATAERDAIRHLLTLAQGQGGRRRPSHFRASRARRRITETLTSRPSAARPDRKRDKRERDRELRELRASMRGIARSDDSKQGHRRKKK